MNTALTRRKFIAAAGTGAALFHVVPRRVLGKGTEPPSDMITRGVIGTGARGMSHVAKYPKTLAVCDVDAHHLERAVKKAGGGCEGYTDFRDLLERKDIDTVHIPTPPHWHALMSIMAAQMGKDVFSEKPMTRFIHEGRAVVDAIRQYGRVFQLCTWGSCGNKVSRDIWKITTNELLGTPLTAVLNRGHGHNFKITAKRNRGVGPLPGVPVPDYLDWDLWLGPASYRPYNPRYTNRNFRGYWDFAGGGLLDMGMHHLTPILWGLRKLDTGPVKIETVAKWPQDPYGAREWQTITATYADGTKVIIESWQWGEKTTEGMPLLSGPDGKYFGPGKTDPPELAHELDTYPGPPKVHNWEHAVKTRDDTNGNHPNAEKGQRCITVLHLANISFRTGRSLTWDPETEQIVDDPEANALVDIPLRAPWHL